MLVDQRVNRCFPGLNLMHLRLVGSHHGVVLVDLSDAWSVRSKGLKNGPDFQTEYMDSATFCSFLKF